MIKYCSFRRAIDATKKIKDYIEYAPKMLVQITVIYLQSPSEPQSPFEDANSQLSKWKFGFFGARIEGCSSRCRRVVYVQSAVVISGIQVEQR